MTKEIYFIHPGNKGVPCELDAVAYGSGRLMIYLNGRRQAVQIAARPEVLFTTTRCWSQKAFKRVTKNSQAVALYRK